MKPARNILVDAARLFFAFAVAAIHLAPNTPPAEGIGQSFVLFAVPFFLMVGMFFFVGKVCGGATVPGWRELHFERLWLPYLAWTVIYAALHAGKDFVLGRHPGINPVAVVLYGGAAVHLYFLPLLLLLQACVWSLALLWRAPERRLAGAFVLLAGGVFAWGGAREGALGFERIFLHAVLYVGGAFLLWRQRDSATFRQINIAVAAALAVVLLCLANLGDPHDWLRYGRGPVAGYAAASLALAWPVRRAVGRWTALLLGCSYGIYLAHFAFVEAFEFAAGRAGWHIKPYDVPEKLGVALAACAGCVALIVLVRTSRPARAWFLGEKA